MTEKDLARKIQILKRIEPRKDWVLLTKNRIFEEPAPVIEVKPQPVSWSFFLKPAFVLPVALLLIGGAIFYFSNLKDLRLAQIEYEQELARMQSLTPSLEQLQASIFQVKENLDKAEITDLKMALEIGKSVELTAKNVKEELAEAKKIVEATSSEKIVRKPKEETLASIIETEKAVEELENSYQLFIGRLIEEIEHWYLGPAEETQFESAKKNYEEGDYNQALEDIYRISYPQD